MGYGVNSLRGQGLTFVAVDKPTRAGLKHLAQAEGLPLSHYLRKIVADNAKMGVQGGLGIGVTKEDKSLQETSQLARIMAAMLILGQPGPWIEEMKHPGAIAELLPEARYQSAELLDRAKDLAKQTLTDALKRVLVQEPQGELELRG